MAPLLVSGLLFALPFSTIGTGQHVTGASGARVRRGRRPRDLRPGRLAHRRPFDRVGRGVDQHRHLRRGRGGLVVALARAHAGSRHALLFGVATGVVYSFTAVLTKSTVDLLDDGVGALFSHWQLYVLLAASAVGLLVNQSAFQAGHVAASLPAISVTNPVLASIFGILMFGETLDAHGPLAVSVTAVSIVAMVIGTITLAALAAGDARGGRRPGVMRPA